MGTTQNKFLSELSELKQSKDIFLIPLVNIEDFEYIRAIGKGSFSQVWGVSLKGKDITFALKKMYKPKIFKQHCQQLIFFEKETMERMYHPFIANSYIAFQDHEYLYIIMDLLSGGDLRFHLLKKKFFSESEVKFFIACAILGLEYLHKNNLIHHDLKPENLLLDENGYVCIADFGISKFYRENNKDDVSGSAPYIAPEILKKENHGFEVDYYSLGVITHELLFGYRPYKSLKRDDITKEIERKEIKITKENFIVGGSDEMADFINKLLKRKKENRLGHNGIEEIKAHKLFKYFNWKDLYLKKLKADFIPSKKLEKNFNFSFAEIPDKIKEEEQKRYNEILASKEYISAFAPYKFFNRFAVMNKKSKKNFENPHFMYEILEEKEIMAFDKEEASARKPKRSSSMKNLSNINRFSFTPESGVKKASLNFRLFSPAPKNKLPESMNLGSVHNLKIIKDLEDETSRDYEYKLDFDGYDNQLELDLQSERASKLDSLRTNLKDKFSSALFHSKNKKLTVSVNLNHQKKSKLLDEGDNNPIFRGKYFVKREGRFADVNKESERIKIKDENKKERKSSAKKLGGLFKINNFSKK